MMTHLLFEQNVDEDVSWFCFHDMAWNVNAASPPRIFIWLSSSSSSSLSSVVNISHDNIDENVNVNKLRMKINQVAYIFGGFGEWMNECKFVTRKCCLLFIFFYHCLQVHSLIKSPQEQQLRVCLPKKLLFTMLGSVHDSIQQSESACVSSLWGEGNLMVSLIGGVWNKLMMDDRRVVTKFYKFILTNMCTGFRNCDFCLWNRCQRH